jgi:hypothetical protein
MSQEQDKCPSLADIFNFLDTIKIKKDPIKFDDELSSQLTNELQSIKKTLSDLNEKSILSEKTGGSGISKSKSSNSKSSDSKSNSSKSKSSDSKSNSSKSKIKSKDKISSSSSSARRIRYKHIL